MKISILLLILMIIVPTHANTFELEESSNAIYIIETVQKNKDTQCDYLNLYHLDISGIVKPSVSTSKTICEDDGSITKSELLKFKTEKQTFRQTKNIFKPLKKGRFPLVVTEKNKELSFDIRSELSPFSDEVFFFLTLNGKRINLLMKQSVNSDDSAPVKFEKFYLKSLGNHYYLVIKYKDIFFYNVYGVEFDNKELMKSNFTFLQKDKLTWLVDTSFQYNKKIEEKESTKNLNKQMKLLGQMGHEESYQKGYGDTIEGKEDESFQMYIKWREASKLSVDDFINKINSHTEFYRYKDWRRPTKKELLSLGEKNLWIFNGRSRAYYTPISIDEDVFGDYTTSEYVERYFLSSDLCSEKGQPKKYYAVYYGLYRQKVYTLEGGAHRPDRKDMDNEYGTKVYCISHNAKKAALRLIRP